jgi:hypothetical protein
MRLPRALPNQKIAQSTCLLYFISIPNGLEKVLLLKISYFRSNDGLKIEPKNCYDLL